MTKDSSNSVLTCSLHEWDGLRAQLLFAFDRPIADGSADGIHVRHGQYSALLVRRGWLRMEAGGDRVNVQPGQWLFCFADRIHQRLSRDAHVLSLRLTCGWPHDAQLFEGPRLMQVVPAADHPELETLARQLVSDLNNIEPRPENPIYTYRWRTRLGFAEYLAHQQRVLQWAMFAGIVLQHYGWKLCIPRGIDGRLARALTLLDERNITEPFPHAALPRATGVTLKQLDRMCRAALKVTLHAYWDQRRVQAARFRLEQPASSIKETAMALGFTQLSHFSVWFKRHAGMSPRTYRKAQWPA